MILENKSDLNSIVTTKQGLEIASRLETLYSEVSAKSNYNIENAFEMITAEALRKIG